MLDFPKKSVGGAKLISLQNAGGRFAIFCARVRPPACGKSTEPLADQEIASVIATQRVKLGYACDCRITDFARS
jgi:hypothetical protein